jgi:hypothetical protein
MMFRVTTVGRASNEGLSGPCATSFRNGMRSHELIGPWSPDCAAQRKPAGGWKHGPHRASPERKGRSAQPVEARWAAPRGKC